MVAVIESYAPTNMISAVIYRKILVMVVLHDLLPCERPSECSKWSERAYLSCMLVRHLSTVAFSVAQKRTPDFDCPQRHDAGP